jgi:hypothetical protein
MFGALKNAAQAVGQAANPFQKTSGTTFADAAKRRALGAAVGGQQVQAPQNGAPLGGIGAAAQLAQGFQGARPNPGVPPMGPAVVPPMGPGAMPPVGPVGARMPGPKVQGIGADPAQHGGAPDIQGLLAMLSQMGRF